MVPWLPKASSADCAICEKRMFSGWQQVNTPWVRVRTIRAYADGVHFAKSQRAFSVQVMGKYMRNNDAALVNELYDLYIVQHIPRIPRPTPEPIK